MTVSAQQMANAIRFLAIDAVNQANSGHPGAPMGMADMAVALWRDHIRCQPNNPHWINRDRFILSNGHASMLQYAVLHLTGYDVTIEDLKSFRQLHSNTAGHPERYETAGVETTTGPLGQGFAMAIGMALGERLLAKRYNTEDFDIIDHYTYVFLGDGCLMEGISHEAASLAGTLKLRKLIALYDDNGISIDGEVKNWFADDTPKRFEAYGWNVIRDVDGHNAEAVSRAIADAKQADAPTLICCKTTIGYGSPNRAGTAASHGAPLGKDERELVAKELNWQHDPFVIPSDIYSAWDIRERGEDQQEAWEKEYEAYCQAHPKLGDELQRRLSEQLPEEFSEAMTALIGELQSQGESVATRAASQIVLDRVGKLLPELVGGSADLTGSNNTKHEHSDVVAASHDGHGNYIYYGVREFGMSAMMNGLANYGGFIPYGGTFLVFSDYARNAMRLSALMKERVIYIMTHDSIGLGEDGPTHQPIEHVASLRLMPNMYVWRPADSVETAIAWQQAIQSKSNPTTLVLSRQGLPKQDRNESTLNNIEKGGYVLKSGSALTLVATGSEVALALTVAEQLESLHSVSTQVVSMPCYETYCEQALSYQHETVLADKPRFVIEAGTTLIWGDLIAGNGFAIGIDEFGASAPAKDLFEHFGFNAEKIANEIGEFMSREQ